jgi:DNA-binding transcriptional ArsR family regulator
MRRDVFQAIADPGRRAIIGLLAAQSMTLNEVSAHFDISRPAISKHIKILEECGLIVIRPQGRERYCEAQLSKLQEVAEWTGQYRTFWNAKLDVLGEYLASDKSSVKKKKVSINHKKAKK